MTQIILDEVLRDKLRNFSQPLEVCDEAGQVVGRFFPTLDLSQYEPLEPQVSNEELQRRSQSEKWYTTDEVLAHLQHLENS